MIGRLARAGRWALMVASFGLGGVAGLGQAPFDAWYLTLLAFAALFALLQEVSTRRRAAFVAWAFATGYFAASLNWIVEPFLVDAARHGWMAPFALVFLSSGLALFWALAGVLSHLAGRSATAFVAAFTLAEALRAVLFTGFPWAQPGHIWIGTPMMQLASFAGALGLCALTLLIASGVWHLVQRRWLVGVVPVVAALALWAGGSFMNPVRELSDTRPIIRLIQPNAAQHEKWDPDMIPIFFGRQLGYTSLQPRPDLTVWPETAIPDLLNTAEPILNLMSREAGGRPLIVGAQRLEGFRLYNSMALLGPEGGIAELYDKHHLVPFGEYFPLGRYFQRFGLRGLAAENGHGYSAGPGAEVFEIPGVGTALPLICYEGIFPRDVAAAPARADFLLLITNDAWFGAFSGPYQHFAQARLRSVEQGLPMIRVANTGISAMINARGEVLASLPLGEEGYLDAPLPEPTAPTLYARTGDAPLLVLLLSAMGGAFVTARRKRVQSSSAALRLTSTATD